MALVKHKTLVVKSPAFSNNGFIPVMYTCDGSGISPELTIQDIPEGTKSLALIMEDPDAPKGTFDHWILWDIPVKERIEEDTSAGTLGVNGRGESKYTPPCPPSGVHHYRFRIYALDIHLQLPMGTDKTAVVKAMDGHILANGELTGLYSK